MHGVRHNEAMKELFILQNIPEQQPIEDTNLSVTLPFIIMRGWWIGYCYNKEKKELCILQNIPDQQLNEDANSSVTLPFDLRMCLSGPC
jgi:hypothetical protein